MSSLFLNFRGGTCQYLCLYKSVSHLPTTYCLILLPDGGDLNPTAPFALQHQPTQVINSFNLRTPLDSEGD